MQMESQSGIYISTHKQTFQSFHEQATSHSNHQYCFQLTLTLANRVFPCVCFSLSDIK